MTTTWRARCSRGHYLASKDVHTTLGPEDWDDTCRCKLSPQRHEPSAETFGHEPIQDYREPCGESGCICYGVGEEHADCACGCDCPRCGLCRQPPEDCDCDK